MVDAGVPAIGGVVLNGNRVIAIRARIRRGWSIKEISRTLGVARNTVRRYARQGTPSRGPTRKPSLDARHERDLVRRIARHWDRRDTDELESELTFKLATIYPKKTVATNWKAFLTRALNRAAINWLRGRHRRERRVTASEQPWAEVDHATVAMSFEVSTDDVVRFDRARGVLTPFLRRVWDAMIAESLDQTRAAIRLGVHRNTIANALRKMYPILKRHGF